MAATIQGVPASWADIRTTVTLHEGRSIEIEDLSALSWKRVVETEQTRGAGGAIRGTPRGQASYEAGATFLESGVAQLEAALAEVDAENISLVEFSIVAIWTPPRAVRNRKVEIFGVRLIEDGFSNALGVEASSSELKFLPTLIISYPDAKGPGNTLLGKRT